MAVTTTEPYTVQGSVGNTPVSRMLIDSGADISLIAKDLVPEAVRTGKPVWVEGVGKRSQFYQTAQVPVTISGKQTEVLMAVTPVHHIPYSVVLGRNVPGLRLTWSLEANSNNASCISSDSMMAGERASQVVQGSARILDPAREQQPRVQQPQQQQSPQNNSKGGGKKVSFKELERESRLQEVQATARLGKKEQGGEARNETCKIQFTPNLHQLRVLLIWTYSKIVLRRVLRTLRG